MDANPMFPNVAAAANVAHTANVAAPASKFPVAPVAHIPCVCGGFTSTGIILVLYILLVIILRSTRW